MMSIGWLKFGLLGALLLIAMAGAAPEGDVEAAAELGIRPDASISVSSLIEEIVQRVRKEANADPANNNNKKNKNGKKEKKPKGQKTKKPKKGKKKPKSAKRKPKSEKRKPKAGNRKQKAVKKTKKVGKKKPKEGKRKPKTGKRKPKTGNRKPKREKKQLKKGKSNGTGSLKSIRQNTGVAAVGQLAFVQSTAVAVSERMNIRVPKLIKAINNKESKKGNFSEAATQLEAAIASADAPRCADATLNTDTIKGSLTVLKNCNKTVGDACAIPESIKTDAVLTRVAECVKVQASYSKKVEDYFTAISNGKTPTDNITNLLEETPSTELGKVRACIKELKPIDETLINLRKACVKGFSGCRTEQVNSIMPIGKCPSPGSAPGAPGGSTAAGGAGATTAAGGAGSGGGATTAAGGGSGTTSGSSSGGGVLTPKSSIAILKYQAGLLAEVASDTQAAVDKVSPPSGKIRVQRADGAPCLELFTKVDTAKNLMKQNSDGKGKDQDLGDKTTTALLMAKEALTNSGVASMKTCEGAVARQGGTLAKFKSFAEDAKAILKAIVEAISALVKQAALPEVANNPSGLTITNSSGRKKKRMVVENVLQQFRFKDEFGH